MTDTTTRVLKADDVSRRGAGRRKSRQATPAASVPRYVLAPLTHRLLGAAIDLVLLLVIAGVVSAAVLGATTGVTQVRIGADGQRSLVGAPGQPLWLPLLVFTVLTALYVVPLMAIWGTTVGGWCLRIRCVRADNGATPGWGVSVRRWLLLYGVAGALAFLPVVGGWAWLATLIVGLSPAWDRSHRLRGYADRFAGDIVVRAPHEH